MVPQRPILLSRSVRANLEFGLRLRGTTPDDRVSELLHRLGLAKLASKSAQTLSGGQIQLVALGRAAVVQPKILLLDEPTANLDPGYVALVEQVLEEWRARYQTTLIWATHNMFQAQRVADRVGLFLDGRIVEVASREGAFSAQSMPPPEILFRERWCIDVSTLHGSNSTGLCSDDGRMLKPGADGFDNTTSPMDHTGDDNQHTR